MSILRDMLSEDILLEEYSGIVRDEGFRIYVYPESYKNPSFHVIYNKEWEVVLQIKDFVILEVKYGNFKKGERLPLKIEKQIKSILQKQKYDIMLWKFLLMTWNANNENYEVDINTEIPI